MRNSLLAVLVVFGVAVYTHATTITTEVVGHAGEDRSVTFEWTFTSGGGDCESGRFANGDWWVAPAAGRSAVTLTALTGTGSGAIYADENPQIEAMGLLGDDYGNRDSTQDIIPLLPLSYDYSTSLVAVIQRDEDTYGGCGTSAILGCCADAYQVVTVLDAVPAGGGGDLLRPNIVRAEKELMSLDDFNLSRLPAVNYYSVPDSAGLENIRKIWSHHIEVLAMRDTAGTGYSEGGRAFRADLVTDDYAATVAVAWHSHVQAMMAAGTDTDQERAALAAMLTYGKDIFYNVFDANGIRDRWYGVGAGQSNGRFPASVFFAALCNDPLYYAALKEVSTTQVNLGGKSVHELDQINIGHNGPIWGNNDTFDSQYNVGGYWGEVLKNQAFNGASGNFTGENSGQRTSRDPYLYIDGPGIYPLGAYGGLNAGPIRAFAAEMYLVPEMCDIVNYDAFITYANRLSDHGRLTAPDPCAPPDPREDPDKCDSYRANGCSYYGLSWDPDSTDAPTWGPDPDSVAAGNWTACIRNGLDPLTGEPQTGRYSDLDGDPLEFGYVSWPVENNWDAIRAGRSACERPWYDRSCTSSEAPTVPGSPAATVRSEREIRVAWDASVHGACGVAHYVVRRNGVEIDSTAATAYADTGLAESTPYSYEVAAVSTGRVRSAWAGPVAATTAADTVPPTVAAVYDTRKPTAVTVDFSEPVDSAAAVLPANYAVDNGVTVISAELASSVRVLLGVTPLAADVTYRLTVQNVTDLSQAANAVASSPADTFRYLPVTSGGLAGYWSLDDAGGSVADGSGNGYDGTVANAVFSADGKYGGCRAFDTASSATIDLGDVDLSPGGTGSDGLTVGLWVMPTGWSNTTYRNPVLIAKSGSFSLNPRANGAGTPAQAGVITTGGSVFYRAGGNIVLDEWTHVACTYDGDSVSVYVNGIRVGRTVLTGTVVQNTSPVTLSTGSFIGKMDEVYLYDRALTPDEVVDMMQAGDVGITERPAAAAPVPADVPLFGLASNPVANLAVLSVRPGVRKYRVTLSDRGGRVFKSWNDTGVLGVADLVPGVYFVTMVADGRFQTVRMVVVD